MKNAMNEFDELLNWLEEQSLLSRDIVNQIIEPYPEDEKNKWEQFRKTFFTIPNGSFLVEPMNSANLCPTLVSALQTVSHYRNQFNNDISMQFRRDVFQRVISVARSLVAEHIGARKETIALVRNTSEANNQLSRGFNKWEGSHVLIWDENHPTNRYVWKKRCPAGSKVNEFSLKGVNFSAADDEVEKAIIERIVNALTKETVILSFSHVSNLSGIKLPARAIVKAVRAHIKEKYNRDENSIHIHVDGAVSWGALKIDVQEMDCDSFSSSSHKWLMGPFETGILYMKTEKAKNFDISIHGYNGNIDFFEKIPEDTSRFEFLGQRDDANLLGMMTAVNVHLNLGKEVIERRVKELQKYLITKLNEMTQRLGVEVKYATPMSQQFSHGVTVMQFRKANGIPFNHPELNAFLYSKSSSKRFAVADTGINDGKTNELRICPHIMNLETTIEAVVERIGLYLKSVLSEDGSAQMEVDKASSINWPGNPLSES